MAAEGTAFAIEAILPSSMTSRGQVKRDIISWVTNIYTWTGNRYVDKEKEAHGFERVQRYGQ